MNTAIIGAVPTGGATDLQGAVEIRILGSNDLPAVAALHVEAFPLAAISRLGRGAAHRYYQSVLSGPHQATGIGAFAQGQLLGFCLGGVWQDPEKYFLKRNLCFVAQRVLTHPGLLKEPFFRDRILTGLRLLWFRRPPLSSIRLREEMDAPPAGRSFGILYVAVAQCHRNRGLGYRLMREAEEIARQKGFQQLDLSVYLDNRAAIALYERMGWQKSLSDGIWKGFMFKPLV